LSEYTDRHPEHAAAIMELFPALVKIEQLKPVTIDATGPFAGTPEPGGIPRPERIGGYRVVRSAAAAWAWSTRPSSWPWAGVSP
jgi:hypothetical protein